MARQKKDAVALNIRLDKAVNDLLVKYCEDVGQTKTMAIERILTNALEEYYDQPKGQRIPK